MPLIFKNNLRTIYGSKPKKINNIETERKIKFSNERSVQLWCILLAYSSKMERSKFKLRRPRSIVPHIFHISYDHYSTLVYRE